MPKWTIDGTNDVVGLVVIAVAIIVALTLIIITLIRRGGGFKIGKGGLEVPGKGKQHPKLEEVPAEEHRRVMDTHSEQLNRIEDAQNRIFLELERLCALNVLQAKDIKATGKALHLMKPAIKTLIDVADGKPKNGNIQEAYQALDDASKAFDDNLFDRFGGGS